MPRHTRTTGRAAPLLTAGGVVQPAPAPRYSMSDTVVPVMAGPAETDAILAEYGFSEDEIAELHESGATGAA